MMGGMMTTISPSNRCYLPIFKENPYGGLERYTDIWRNFLNARDMTVEGWQAENRIKEWNGKLINDVVFFNTEADKAWFMLRWS